MEATSSSVQTSVALVICDWAGSLIDFGSHAPVEVILTLFQERGVPVSIAQAREPMGAAKRDHIAKILAMPEVADRWQTRFGAAPCEADVDALYADFLPLQKEILAKHSVAIPGAAETFKWLHERNIPIGSSTGYTRELMEIVLPIAREQGIDPDYCVTSDVVQRGRPAPDMIHKIMADAGVTDPKLVVKVDDTPVGIAAAKNAGCIAVGLAATGNELGLTLEEFNALEPGDREQRLAKVRKLFEDAQADYVIDSIADLPGLLATI
ncbi:phosphonoacetaldehyde hydrolase [bacterium]|nr:phosphonoacetaldehyde hydrolase [bacterium]